MRSGLIVRILSVVQVLLTCPILAGAGPGTDWHQSPPQTDWMAQWPESWVKHLQSFDSPELFVLAHRQNRHQLPKSIQDYHLRLIHNEQYDEFLKNRRSLTQAIDRQLSITGFYWLNRFDQVTIPALIHSFTKQWQFFPDKTLGPLYWLRLQRLYATKDRESLRVIESTAFRSQEARGWHDHRNGDIYVTLGHPVQMIVPLVHELAHKFDFELLTYRSDILYERLVLNARSTGKIQPQIHGRRWFLGDRKQGVHTYRFYFKELIPIFHSCLLWVASVENNPTWIDHAAKRDLEIFGDALFGKKSCSDIASEWIFQNVPRPRYALSNPELELYQAMMKYQDLWLDRNGLEVERFRDWR